MNRETKFYLLEILSIIHTSETDEDLKEYIARLLQDLREEETV